jgi:ferritin-like protein
METEYLIQFFDYGHLSVDLQQISRPFSELAGHIVEYLPKNPERTTALRKLLEAKDCAVRSKLFKS